MFKKYTWILILAAILALTGCGKTDSKDATVHLAIPSDIVTMDSHKTTNDYIVPMNVFDTLFSLKKNEDGSTRIDNSLVDKYELTDDGLTYHFTLKDGIVFSDGTPLTAQDVKFTFERILKLPDSAQTDNVILIEGAQEMLDGKADSLRGITVDDDKNFSITLTAPFSGFTSVLATPAMVIYSEKIVTEAGDDFGMVPEKTIGSGPYIIKEWTRGSGLTFEYNPNYWGPEPSAKKIDMKIMEPQSMDLAFQKGDLDILDCLYIDSAIVKSTYKTDKYKDHIVSVDRLGQNFLMMNENIEPLGNVQVRKAIQQAIDRESLLSTIYDGDGMLEDGIFTTGCIGYSKNNQGWLKYDPENAKKLLAEAGYADGFDLELCVDSTASDSVKNSIQVISENLNAVGIRTSIKSIDHASYLDIRNSGELPCFWAYWLLDYNDPDNIIYTFFGSKDNVRLRSLNYSDDSVINRVAAAKVIAKEDDRLAEYEALEKKILQDDAACVPMFSQKHLFVTSDKVAEFIPHWAGWNDIYFDQITLK
ncbi:ABC transporter substrate-binding protein [Butyrivibrio sp. AE3004]|uniref:ABC transporter substrate-binding protein n=1 Tax=Butyrivibrio sp. AE3004 TaxID=1506994 RepID=UPI00068E8CB3|nr:ABC transporter substrate-binding protein [Butyrivibrio sp. AE3004]